MIILFRFVYINISESLVWRAVWVNNDLTYTTSLNCQKQQNCEWVKCHIIRFDSSLQYFESAFSDMNSLELKRQLIKYVWVATWCFILSRLVYLISQLSPFSKLFLIFVNISMTKKCLTNIHNTRLCLKICKELYYIN